MSIVGEILAGATAKKLEEIILNAINGYGDVKSAVCGFVKYELIDWYYCECEEASMTPNPKILKRFPPKPDLSNDSSPMNSFGRDNYGK